MNVNIKINLNMWIFIPVIKYKIFYIDCIEKLNCNPEVHPLRLASFSQYKSNLHFMLLI